MNSSSAVHPAERFFESLNSRGISSQHLNAVLSIPGVVDDIAHVVRTSLLHNHEIVTPIDRIVFTDVSLAAAGVSKRIINSLMWTGITTVGVLSLRSREQVYILSNVGETSMKQLDDVMSTYGMSFRDELLETIAHKLDRFETPSEEMLAYVSSLKQ